MHTPQTTVVKYRIHFLALSIIFLALVCPALGQPAPARTPKPAQTPLPPHVEMFFVKTSSPENPNVPFYVRVPATYVAQPDRKLHRVLFLCPIADHDGLDAMQQPDLLDLADSRGWFIMAPYFHSADKRDRKTAYYYPEKWSGKAVLDALEIVKKKYPIATTGLLMQGHSGGAQFVHRFAIWAPERVAAVAVNSSSWYDDPNEKSQQVAWFISIGEADPAYEASLSFVDKLRKVGAVPLFRSYVGLGHQFADGGSVKPMNVAFLTFYDELTKSKLANAPSLIESKPKPIIPLSQMPFVGDSQRLFYTKNTDDASNEIAEDERVYLPNESIAKIWATPYEGEK